MAGRQLSRGPHCLPHADHPRCPDIGPRGSLMATTPDMFTGNRPMAFPGVQAKAPPDTVRAVIATPYCMVGCRAFDLVIENGLKPYDLRWR